MKFWKYGRVALALTVAVILGLTITCCGVYTSGYMYVTGTQYGQIAGYKIDHDFGYLTPVTGSPFSAGSNPVQEVIVPGGRFLAVLNEGTNGTGGSITMFTIGGAGVLYPQHTYQTSGIDPVSLTLSPSGRYLYALDRLAPDGSGRGDVTVFSIDSDTGKLTLITNQNTFNTDGTQLPYFEVNFNPIHVVTGTGTGGTYLWALDTAYTANSTDASIPTPCQSQPAGQPCTTPDVFLYAINETNGQLTLTQNAPLTLDTLPGAASTISVSPNQKYIYIADTGLGLNNTPGRILPFTVGAGGVLQILVGGPVTNLGGTSLPDAIMANSNTQFLYVANFGPGSVTQPNSSISAFTITSNGQLQPIATAQNPYPTGSGPIWMVEDPTNQYLYTVNFNDNTITGKVIDATHGQLSGLLKGPAATPTVGKPTFVAVTGRTF
jgi:6-phosphogluconolactonase (cycloisomerase 2 family)